MAKVVLGVAVSLDGYIEGPGGAIDWCFTDQDYGMASFIDNIGGIVMGRKSFEQMMQLGGNPWPDKPIYVFSRNASLEPAKGIHFVSGDLVSVIRELLRTINRNLWLFGGGDLIAQCIELDLVDRYWLSVHPILLGGGMKLFPAEGHPRALTLTDQKAYSSGLVSLTYSRVHEK